MKILFTGANGQLGQELKQLTAEKGIFAVGLTRKELDITQADSVSNIIGKINPNVVINCAAYTAVDKAESEPEKAYAINRDGAANLARVCAAENIILIHISTDYVFDGGKQSAYLEDDPVSPINVYGSSKVAGEQEIISLNPKHIILRTSWLYGYYGNNFVKTMLRLGTEREQIGVVHDQFGCPTHAADLALASLTIADSVLQDDFNAWGIYHFANQGIVSWFEFAESIFKIAEKNISLKLKNLDALTTDQYPTAAVRPVFSVLSVKKIGQQFGIDPPFYLNSLKEMLSKVFAASK